MLNTERFFTPTHAMIHLIEEFGFSRQEANNWVRLNGFRMGTDRSTWVKLPNSCPIK